jgi:hypothetical protein
MRATSRGLLLLIGLLAGLAGALPYRPTTAAPADKEVCASTFSIVALDVESKEWGVATASRVLAVGNCVPWAKANVGAIATQSYVNVSYGPKGLELLADGKSAKDVVQQLTEADKRRELRQLAVVDKQGNAVGFTGKECIPWAGGKEGKGYVCVGNLLAGEAVVNDMAKTFEETKGPLAWRLLLAMEATSAASSPLLSWWSATAPAPMAMAIAWSICVWTTMRLLFRSWRASWPSKFAGRRTNPGLR